MNKEIKIKVKGIKGDSPTDEQIVELIKPLIPKPIKGEDGVKGDSPTSEQLMELIRPLIPQVKNGETPTDEKIISLIKPLIPNNESIINIINNENTLIKKEKIEVNWGEYENKEYKVEDIKGLPEKLKKLEYSHAKAKSGYDQVAGAGGSGTGGGVQSVVAGTNITVDNTDPANPIVNATGGGTDTPSFETVSKNLKAYPFVLGYTGSQLTTITYTLPASQEVVKTLAYTGSKLTSMTLSGDLPSGIDTVKTLAYTGDQLTSIIYS